MLAETTALDTRPVDAAPVREPLSISDEDLERLVAAGVAEQFGGFTRQRAGVDWSWMSVEGKEHSIAELPSVRECQFAFLDIVEMFCTEASTSTGEVDGGQLTWMLQRSRVRADGHAHFRCIIIKAAGSELDPTVTPLAAGDSIYPAESVALALLDLLGADMAGMHRELFPHRYIVT